MTTTTITKKYSRIVDGKGWILYSDVGNTDTKIIHSLLDLVKSRTDLSYFGILKELKAYYSSKKEKSKCCIYHYDSVIHVEYFTSSLPRFYISKKH